MKNAVINYVTPLVLAGVVAGCAGPSYIDKADADAIDNVTFSKVLFHVHDTFHSDPPKCVAVLPFKTPKDGISKTNGISLDQTETVRRAFYAHISPQGKHDIEIPRIDFVLNQLSEAEKNDFALVGERLKCDALIIGDVTEYGSSYFALYSKVSVGADLKMIRTSDGKLFWEGQHVAKSHGGALPLSPVGLAMGLLDAAANVNEEQIFRMIDDLARRLVKTIPDNRLAVLEEPISFVEVVVRKSFEEDKTLNNFIIGLAEEPHDKQKIALIEAIKGERFGDVGTNELHKELIALDPENAENYSRYARYLTEQGNYDEALKSIESLLDLNARDHAMHYLKAKILIKQDDLAGADSAIIQAIALDDTKAAYFNGLGYINSIRGNTERSLAAYHMALKRNPSNGFAYYNIGVSLFNMGDMEGAADAFYGAGLAYLKTGGYGQVEKAVSDLKELASEGLNLTQELKTLEEALSSLTKGKKKDA